MTRPLLNRSELRNTNIFKYSHHIGYGHSTLDEIAYFKEFPKGPNLYDVQITKDNYDSFPFIMVNNAENMKILVGEHGDTYESLVAESGIRDEKTIIRGRVWVDSNCMVIDQATMAMKNILNLEITLRESHQLDISKWQVFNSTFDVVVPNEVYQRKVAKLVKHIEKLMIFLDKKLKDRWTFEDNIRKNPNSFDYERIGNDIKSSLMDYEFFYTHDKIPHEQEVYQMITGKLRGYYQLLENYLKAVASKIDISALQEFYRNKMEKCCNESEDVMKRFCNFVYNGHKPIMVDYVTIEKLVFKHGEQGVIIVSAYREDVDTNDQNTRTLLSNIQRSGYCYLPVYSCHQEHEQKVTQYQASFLVFNKPKNDKFEIKNFSELLEAGKSWCEEYDKECCIVKSPNESAISLEQDACRYVNCIPCTIPERMIRIGKGEIMLY